MSYVVMDHVAVTDMMFFCAVAGGALFVTQRYTVVVEKVDLAAHLVDAVLCKGW